MLINLPIISPWIALISEKMDLLKLFKESQAICFIPSFWEDIKTNLATNRKLQPHIRELLLQDCHKLLPIFVYIIQLVELRSFIPAAVASNRADIDHSISVLDESASFNWNIHISNVFKAEIHKFD